mmetsp:Transcript_18297/g.41814  ORF Transcript_18297/g.41814 Transcript_18297/m.41814 type:complete len:1128 (-) Transcript_18297:68-3451(-)|eukprot:CAMPEP_0113309698 /NCGR_PEP_ID=MMETSP0010_2-20120614/7636_1 /TAXON_ID=216773 ORGANISM="Corethron hystrix, Strain 308" /NCGR_SAMPLE_ID=MMETSP0010_2 /ASSEMBLY_ACC=CAM_ASM_000155 /LENGTH=1127 /DNA_ID=CAMNT_0000164999 /DNA_START=262 /DNA_END=3645 /DNA_ORIENTATION=- /assembly_acc=CAM_ASM_000155
MVKIDAAALATFLALSYSSGATAFTTPQSTFNRRQTFRSPALLPNPSRSLSSGRQLHMFVQEEHKGSDAFVQIMEEDKSTSKLSDTVRSAPKNVRDLVRAGAIPAAAAVGFVLNPVAGSVAFGALQGAAFGAGGAVLRSKLVDVTEKSARGALASALMERGYDPSSGGVTAEEVEVIRTEYGCDGGDFDEYKCEIFRRFVANMMKTPATKTSDIAELTKLKVAIGLSNIQTGNAMQEAGKAVYNDCCLWTSTADLEDPENADRRKLDKMLFLADRLFAKEETEEAYRYETARIARIFSMDAQTMEERVKSIAVPFYQRALASTRTKLDTVSSDMLQRARGTIGIDEETMDDLHQSTYLEEVQALLETEDTENKDKWAFSDQDMDRLVNLQSVLELSDISATRLREQLTMPLFKTAIADAVDKASQQNSDKPAIYANIVQRQAELRIGDEHATAMLVKSLRQNLEAILVEAANFIQVENNNEAAESIQKLVDTKVAIVSLMSQGGMEEADAESLYIRDNGDKPVGSYIKVNMSTRNKLYTNLLQQTLLSENNSIPPQAQKQLATFKDLTGVADSDARKIYTETCGPVLKNVLEDVSSDMLTLAADPAALQAAKDRIVATEENLRTPLSDIQEYKQAVYEARLAFANSMSTGGIISQELADALVCVKELLGLQDDITDVMHVKSFGDAYRKSVVEAMGSTGIIPREYAGFLDKLRARLMLNEKDARSLYNHALGTRVKPMLNRLLLEMDRANLTPEQQSQKYGTDMGEDLINSAAKGTLGMGVNNNAFMGECMNLVDFYLENEIPMQKQTGTKAVTKTITKTVTENGAGKEVTEEVSEEVPVYETTYPVNAHILKVEKNENDLENLYRSYLATSYMCEDKAQAARYDAAKTAFGGILGFPKTEMERIGGSIGGMVYDNYVKQVTATKSKLDQQDMMFLANIQSKLGMSEKDCEALLQEGQRKLARGQIDRIMSLAGEQKAEAVATFRSECVSNGLNIRKDLNMPQQNVDLMLRLDIEYAINRGDTESMEEIQEAFDQSDMEFQEVVEGMVLAKVKKYIQNIQADIREGQEAHALFYIKQLVKYITIFHEDMDIGLHALDPIERKKVVAIYRAAADAVPEDLQTLTTTLG